MKQRLSMALRRTSDDQVCEFGEEARVPETLTLTAAFCSQHALDAEYARFCRNPIDGIYVVPSTADPHCWYGVVFIRAGIFTGGIFRFTLNIQKDYPNTTFLPQIKFDLPIMHPHICPNTRILELMRYFPDGWKKEKHHIQYALLVAQRIFFSLDADFQSCINPEAALLWQDERQKFKEMAKECVNKSRSHVYDEPINDDPRFIRFTPWDSSVHDKTRQFMKHTGEKNISGLSWFDADRLTCMIEPLQRAVEITKERRADNSVPIERLDLSSMSESIPNSARLEGLSRASNVSEEVEEVSDV